MLSITAIKGRLESAWYQALRREGFIATFLLCEISHTEAPRFDVQALIHVLPRHAPRMLLEHARQSGNARTT